MKTPRAQRPVIALTPEVITLPANHARRGAFCGVSYSDAIAKAGGVPVILPLTRDPSLLRQLWQHCDGLLLTGGADVSHKFYAPRMSAQQRATIQGADEARDTMEIWLIRAALRADRPVLGICRGIQVMNVALGGTLLPDVPGHRHPESDGLIHKLQWEPSSKIRAALGVPVAPVNTSHHQVLDRVAPGLRVTARSEDGVIEAVEHATARFFWGVQFHPERLVDVAPQYRQLFTALVAASSR
ncbi:MAG: gamma-glutamyl-gamma-aminobutyrate hydrolase family protein [Verrucomicrobiota bacterium]